MVLSLPSGKCKFLDRMATCIKNPSYHLMWQNKMPWYAMRSRNLIFAACLLTNAPQEDPNTSWRMNNDKPSIQEIVSKAFLHTAMQYMYKCCALSKIGHASKELCCWPMLTRLKLGIGKPITNLSQVQRQRAARLRLLSGHWLPLARPTASDMPLPRCLPSTRRSRTPGCLRSGTAFLTAQSQMQGWMGS